MYLAVVDQAKRDSVLVVTQEACQWWIPKGEKLRKVTPKWDVKKAIHRRQRFQQNVCDPKWTG